MDILLPLFEFSYINIPFFINNVKSFLVKISKSSENDKKPPRGKRVPTGRKVYGAPESGSAQSKAYRKGAVHLVHIGGPKLAHAFL